MSKKHRENAIKIINDAISKYYDLDTTKRGPGNYILNQLMKAGYTNRKILVTAKEAKKDLKNAAFMCNTSELEDLVPQPLVLSDKDFKILSEALANPPEPNTKLKALFRPVVHFVQEGLSEHSPCGDEDSQAPVSSHEFEVTCPGCKAWLNKKANPKG